MRVLGALLLLIGLAACGADGPPLPPDPEPAARATN